MKRKIFGVGTHNGIPFSKEDVLEFFKNVTKIPVIFDHTSVYSKDNLTAPLVGECIVEVNHSNGDVLGTFEFNEDGKTYEKNKAIKGISCELSLVDKIAERVAVLPRRIKQAVEGAEFANKETVCSEILEFAEEEKMPTLEDVLEFMKGASIGDKITIMSAIVGSLSEADTRAARALAYEFAEKIDDLKEVVEFAKKEKVTAEDIIEFAKTKGINLEVKEVEKELTIEEIRAEERAKITAEFAQEKMENWALNFLEKNKEKISPAIKPLIEFALETVVAKGEEVIEFAENDKMTAVQKMESIFQNLKGVEFAEITPEGGELGTNKWVEKAKELGKKS